MNVLLDTCAFLWLVTEDSKNLSSEMTAVYLNENNKIFLSIVSAWEISIKTSLGKLDIEKPVHQFLQEQINVNDLSVLSITLDHVTGVSELPYHHKDPFDRLLIAQAIAEGFHILTADRIFTHYDVRLC